MIHRPICAGVPWTARIIFPGIGWVIALTLAWLGGCESGGAGKASAAPPGGKPTESADLEGIRQAEHSVRARPPAPGAQVDAPPPLTVKGEAIEWAELRPLLAEAAGGQVVEELALGRVLGAEMRRRGLTLTAEEVRAEQKLVAGSLVRGAGAKPEDVDRLVSTVRRARGLGEVRYALLLERNAMLRRLVQDEIVVTDEMVDQNFAIMYGPKIKVRVIVTPTQAAAREVYVALNGKAGAREGDPVTAADPTLASRFGEAASRVSTDESAGRGGSVEVFSPDDPAYPTALRAAAVATDVGRLSEVFALEQGYGLLLVEEKIPAASVQLGDVIEGVRAEAKLRQERLAMDRLARRMLGAAGVSVSDPGLRWSWEARAGGS